MVDLVILVIIGVGGIVIGVVIGYFYAKEK